MDCRSLVVSDPDREELIALRILLQNGVCDVLRCIGLKDRPDVQKHVSFLNKKRRHAIDSRCKRIFVVFESLWVSEVGRTNPKIESVARGADPLTTERSLDFNILTKQSRAALNFLLVMNLWSRLSLLLTVRTFCCLSYSGPCLMSLH